MNGNGRHNSIANTPVDVLSNIIVVATHKNNHVRKQTHCKIYKQFIIVSLLFYVAFTFFSKVENLSLGIVM